MIDGQSSRAPINGSPAQRAVQTQPERCAHNWNKLDPTTRLRVIERALGSPANDLCDGFPVAL